MSFVLKTITNSSLFPLRLNYSLNVNESYVYTDDGYSFYNYSFLNQLNDVTAQKNSSLLLTQKDQIKNFYKSDKQPTENFKLGIYAFLKFKGSNRYVTATGSTPKALSAYTTNDMAYFRSNIEDNSVTIFLRSLVLTVDRVYPYNITLQPVDSNDIYNQQKFEYIQEGNNILLYTKVIDTNNNVIRRYVSFSPVDYSLRAIGTNFNNYIINDYYLLLDSKINLFYPDYLSESVAVEYYNNLGNINLQNTEIQNKIPFTQTNFLIHVPFKKDTGLVELSSNAQYFDVPADILTLKNILTPSYTVAKIAAPSVLPGFNPATIFNESNTTSTFDGNILKVFVKNSPEAVKIGTFPNDLNPNHIVPQKYGFVFPYNGGTNLKSAQPSPTFRNNIGITSSGIILANYTASYKPLTSFDFNLVSTVTLSGLDLAGGTVDSQNIYKYYTGNFINNGCWDDIFVLSNYYKATETYPDGHSKIIGVAFDGYPIYGPFGYSIPTDNTSGTIQMRSSYTYVSSIPTYRPPLSTYPLGAFIQDYTYIYGQGTLDKSNGRYCVTPEYPSGTYAYFLTFDTNNQPEYPYVVGSEFYGVTNFASISTIDTNTGSITLPPTSFAPPTPPIISTVVNVPRNNLFVTGYNGYGQLALRTTSSTSTWTVAQSGFFNKIVAGANHVLALSSNNLYVAGSNDTGQCGAGSVAALLSLKQQPGSWADIFAGANSTFVLATDGTLYAAGDNNYFQLGDSSLGRTNVTKLSPVTTAKNFVKIACGKNYSLALDIQGRMYCTGNNAVGQFGNGDTISTADWTLTKNNSIWSDITVGDSHSLALQSGTLYGTGNNNFGQLGTGDTNTPNVWTPITPPWDTGIYPTKKWTAIACGIDSSYALAGTDLYVVGSNSNGQIGLGTTPSTTIWQKIPGSYNAVAAGLYHALALSGDKIWATGRNVFGELGLQNTSLTTYWTLVSGLSSGWSSIAASGLGNSSYGTRPSTITYTVTAYGT